MYVGHVGIALGAYGADRGGPLWLFVFAAQGCDWVELMLRQFVLRDTAVLWSHSIPGTFVGAAVLAVATWIALRSVDTAGTVALVYVSHLGADFITGLIPLVPGQPRVGLVFYERPVWDFAIEAGLVLGGWLVYRRVLSPLRRGGMLAWSVPCLLIVIQGMADLYFAMFN